MDVANAGMHLLGARRAPMNQDEFDTKFNYLKSSKYHRYSEDGPAADFCICCRLNVRSPRRGFSANEPVIYDPNLTPLRQLLNILETYIPIFYWVPKYDLNKDFIGDLYSGVCLGLLSLAQGLAFSFLSGLPPVCGLYTTGIAAFVYVITGTSPFSFLGTNAIICYFFRNVLERFSTPQDYIYLMDEKSEIYKKLLDGSEQLGYASALTLLTAGFQAAIYMFRVEFLFSYVSKHVVGGICFGTAVRIVLSQLQHILHVRGNQCVSEFSATLSLIASKTMPPTFTQCTFLSAYKSLHSNRTLKVFPLLFGEGNGGANFTAPPGCVLSVWDCFRFLNIYTLAFSVCSFLMLVFIRQIVGPIVQNHVNFPVPFEFVLMMITSFIAYGFDMQYNYNVEVIKHFGTGWNFVGLPSYQQFHDVFYDAFALALPVYAMHYYAASEMSRICKYRMDSRQELMALIVSSGIVSLLGGHPPSQSINRNRIGLDAGACTIFTNIFIVFFIIPMVFWAKYLFGFIPVCVFSAIIVHSMGEYLKEPRHFSLLWAVSKLDAVGLCLLFFVLAQWPKFQHLVNVTGSGTYYAERNCYGSDLLEESGVAIVRFEAALLFHNVQQFRRDIAFACSQIKGQLLGPGIGTRTGSMKSNNALSVKDVQMRSTLLISGDVVPNFDAPGTSMQKVCIIDFSSVPTIDTAGLEAMRDVFEQMAEQKVRILYAAVNATIRHRFKMCEGFEVVPKHYFFPSVHDAVLCAQQMGGIVAPSVHMSVSMNGYRDLIALSSATSHHDMLNRSPQPQQQDNPNADNLSAGTRNSFSEQRITPPLTLKL
ncbi:unnamed protein product [Bursaphelenchus xylophilus]|uniref:(pine wood nematode) hypothetical protein n=1 Tax=Bursaphelenchus xylophilus TaxID=6326 RepID=A0A7I8WGF1_BURXY|nr:unnamed protein product [Bursaphelenchus xylophilus]CAG9111121.1 unnamed protein product [Bursaphelenchus xylophilus]